MKHYEMVILVDPNQSERAGDILAVYVNMVKESGGTIHRQEDVERFKLFYTMKKSRAAKAHFLILNIECDYAVVKEIKKSLSFNDLVIRYLVLNRRSAITADSPLKLEKIAEDSGNPMPRLRVNRDTRLDYRDIYLHFTFLSDYIIESGRILPMRLTGLTSNQQRHVASAIKLCRYLGLLPYTDRHR